MLRAPPNNRRMESIMSKSFFIAPTKRRPAVLGGAVDIAARHLVYKLFSATDGRSGGWHELRKFGEAKEAVDRAVERGWVVVRQEDGGKRPVQGVALTDEGRLVARKGLRG